MENGLLYQNVADSIEGLINEGALKVGDKLMSVRALKQDRGISISTAFRAYVHLESKGLIEARPKSGYYVKFSPGQIPGIPDQKPAPAHFEDISVDEMTALVYRNLSEEGIVKLSIATPDLSLLPEAKLNKALMEAVRKSNSSCLNYEEIKGNLRLRQQVARHSFSWGGQISPEEVVTTNWLHGGNRILPEGRSESRRYDCH